MSNSLDFSIFYFSIVAKNIHTPPPMEGFLVCPPRPHWKYKFSPILFFKNLICFCSPPPTLEFPLTFCGEVLVIFRSAHFHSAYLVMIVSIYMLFTGREVRMGKNCARGLEYGPRPKAEGRAQDQGHSFFPIRTDLDR